MSRCTTLARGHVTFVNRPWQTLVDLAGLANGLGGGQLAAVKRTAVPEVASLGGEQPGPPGASTYTRTVRGWRPPQIPPGFARSTVPGRSRRTRRRSNWLRCKIVDAAPPRWR